MSSACPPRSRSKIAFCKTPVPMRMSGLSMRCSPGRNTEKRWARRWLDVVRFAETNGYERDAVKPNAWRYRDYVIRSLNRDTPYDRFLTEQLAGDELDDADSESRIAAGFLRLGAWDDEPADPLQDEFDQLDDIVSATSDVFLGLTLGCARCHDHKFEPLTQLDYYRMAAIFRPLERPRDGRTELDVPLEGTTKSGEAIRAYVMKESTKNVSRDAAPASRASRRGGAAGRAGDARRACVEQPEFLHAGETTTRRRLTLARWLTSPRPSVDGPRDRQPHLAGTFRRGTRPHAERFRHRAEEPTHPELLDWLACWFMEQGWSMKRLHALILTSATYRMSTRVGNRRFRNAIRRTACSPIGRGTGSTPRRSATPSSHAADGSISGLYGPSVYPEIPRARVWSRIPTRTWSGSRSMPTPRIDGRFTR